MRDAGSSGLKNVKCPHCNGKNIIKYENQVVNRFFIAIIVGKNSWKGA
ncbi:MAG: hypothetical protein ACOC80_08245 [Petrotogales bacterium]